MFYLSNKIVWVYVSMWVCASMHVFLQCGSESVHVYIGLCSARLCKSDWAPC